MYSFRFFGISRVRKEFRAWGFRAGGFRRWALEVKGVGCLCSASVLPAASESGRGLDSFFFVGVIYTEAIFQWEGRSTIRSKCEHAKVLDRALLGI